MFWVLFAVFVIVLTVAMEGAFLFGKSRAGTTEDKSAGHIAALAGTQIGFLALLIGFTFSMSLSRYNERKDILQREINDIGTCYFRADLLPETYSAEAKKLLKEYAALRAENFSDLRDLAAEKQYTARTDKVQNALWDNAMRAVRDPAKLDAPITALYVNTLNSVISDRSERMYSLVSNHVPAAIIWLLLAIAVLAVGLSGYSSGLHLRRSPVVRFVLIVSASLAIAMIIDLDHPRRGLIRIDQSAMQELADSM